ncbi:MAG: STAS domain-containing protein [Richelia sp. CSU_2_1]|nr:STAS domain-containing protein [Richelia sp. CSU_2_1]
MSVLVKKIILSHEVLESSQFPHFKKEIERSIASGAKILLVDFSNIAFLNNSELMAVVAIVKLVKSSPCMLLISSMSDRVRILFELTGLEKIFQYLPSPEEVAITSEITQPLSRLPNVAIKREVTQPLGGLQNLAS